MREEAAHGGYDQNIIPVHLKIRKKKKKENAAKVEIIRGKKKKTKKSETERKKLTPEKKHAFVLLRGLSALNPNEHTQQ